MSIKSVLQRLKILFFADSWIELLTDWLHSLPLPYWLTCTFLGLFAAIGISANSLFHANDAFLATAFFILSFVFSYELYIVWYLAKDTNNLIYNPEIGFPKNSASTKPGILIILFRLSLIIIRVLFSSLILLILFIGLWETFSTLDNSTEALENLEIAIGAPILMLSLYMILHIAFKITKVISLIYRVRLQETYINLLNLSPLYKLSRITQKIAFYIIPLATVFVSVNLIAYLGNDNFPSIGSDYFPSTGNITVDIFIYILFAAGPILTLTAGMVFILPVFWIRKRIIDAKSNMKSELGLKLQIAFEAQDQYAKEENFTKVKDLKEYTDVLVFRKEYIERISEWPWETRVFREFSAAIFIPIILSILQLYLDRWLGK